MGLIWLYRYNLKFVSTEPLALVFLLLLEIPFFSSPAWVYLFGSDFLVLATWTYFLFQSDLLLRLCLFCFKLLIFGVICHVCLRSYVVATASVSYHNHWSLKSV